MVVLVRLLLLSQLATLLYHQMSHPRMPYHHHQLPPLRTHTSGPLLLPHPPNQLLPTSNHRLLRQLLSLHDHEHLRLLFQHEREHLLQLPPNMPPVLVRYALFQVEDSIPVEVDHPPAPVMLSQVWKIWSSLWQRSSHRTGPVTRWMGN